MSYIILGGDGRDGDKTNKIKQPLLPVLEIALKLLSP